MLCLVGALLLVTAAAAGCSDEGDAGAESTTTSTSAPTTTTTAPPQEVPGQPVSVQDLQQGQCFEQRVVPGQGQTTVEELVRIDCAQPHDNEVYRIARLPQEVGAPYPGTEEITAFADEQCLAGFEEFVGVQYELAVFEIGHLVPSEESWALPDRQVVCFLFHREGEKLQGSAQGSRRCATEFQGVEEVCAEVDGTD